MIPLKNHIPKSLLFSPSFLVHFPGVFKVKHSNLAGITLLFSQALSDTLFTQRDACLSLRQLLFYRLYARHFS